MMKRNNQTLGVYIHIPFCLERCAYCDFLTFARADRYKEPYVQALCAEIKAQSRRFALDAYVVDSIYFGGGTPSLLSGEAFLAIWDVLEHSLVLAENREVSLEMNPGTLTDSKLAAWKRRVNRISLGVQSFNNGLLEKMGRTHSAEKAVEDIQRLQAFGFENLNVDLLYGVPQQTVVDIERDLAYVSALNIPHISAYSLILEERTQFSYAEKKGTLFLPSEEEVDEQESGLREGLQQRGYVRYEISNFCKPNFASRHNKKYWQSKDYWGFGLGASSYLAHERYTNETSLQTYLRASSSTAIAHREERSAEEDCFEGLMMGLRLTEGIDRKAYKEWFGLDPYALCASLWDRLQNERWAEVTPTHVRLTAAGLQLQNQILVQLWEALETR